MHSHHVVRASTRTRRGARQWAPRVPLEIGFLAPSPHRRSWSWNMGSGRPRKRVCGELHKAGIQAARRDVVRAARAALGRTESRGNSPKFQHFEALARTSWRRSSLAAAVARRSETDGRGGKEQRGGPEPIAVLPCMRATTQRTTHGANGEARDGTCVTNACLEEGRTKSGSRAADESATELGYLTCLPRRLHAGGEMAAETGLLSGIG